MCNVLPLMFCSCLHTLYIKALWHGSLIFNDHKLYWTQAILSLDTWIVCMSKSMQSWYGLVRRKLLRAMTNLFAPSVDLACRSKLFFGHKATLAGICCNAIQMSEYNNYLSHKNQAYETLIDIQQTSRVEEEWSHFNISDQGSTLVVNMEISRKIARSTIIKQFEESAGYEFTI